MTAIVRDAIRVLEALNVKTAAQASSMLRMWRRYGDMSVDDITAVLDHFRKRGESGE